MSIATYIIPMLKGQEIKSEDWYLKYLMDALNKWFKMELEPLFMQPTQKISGIGVLPSYPPQTITVTDTPAMYLSARRQRFTFEEVKEAMWGGNNNCQTEADIKLAARKSFMNLFMLVGKKINENWKTAVGNKITFNGCTTNPIFWVTTQYATYGSQFFDAVQNPLMTPQLFHTMLGSYLALAINNTPPTAMAIVGRYCQVYAFTGTVTLKLPMVS